MQWVLETAARLPRVPSIAFIHIPVPQFMNLWNEQPTNGSKSESVNCPLADTGVFELLRYAGLTCKCNEHHAPALFLVSVPALTYRFHAEQQSHFRRLWILGLDLRQRHMPGGLPFAQPTCPLALLYLLDAERPA
jgi:hypothetical protein